MAEADDLTGAHAPPRANGELVFAAPWERRAFGVTIAACRSGAFTWDAFRERLIARIAEDPDRAYWESWAAALEDAAGVDVRERVAVLAARPHGHDH